MQIMQKPHYTLSRIYQKQGDKDNAQKSLAMFQRFEKIAPELLQNT